MKIEVTQYKKNEHGGKVKGSADIVIYIDNVPLTIRDVKVIDTENGGKFYALPNKEYTDQTGEKKYFNYIGFFTKEAYKEFSLSLRSALGDYFARGKVSAPPAPFPTCTTPVLDDSLPF